MPLLGKRFPRREKLVTQSSDPDSINKSPSSILIWHLTYLHPTHVEFLQICCLLLTDVLNRVLRDELCDC